jgi:hypothetical protein
MSPRGGGFLDAARQILEEAGEPLHGLEIVKRARERNMFTSEAKDDWSLVRTITSDIKRGGNRRHMTIMGKGYYGLEDWGSVQDIPAPRETGSPKPASSPVQAPSDPTLEHPVAFSAGGRSFTLTGRQVLDAARRTLAGGLPPESQEYLSWAVEIDGHLVGVKWLFSLVTGVQRHTFTTFDAAPLFRRMGLSVQQLRIEPESEAVETAELTKQKFLERVRAALAVLVSSLEYDVQTLVPNARLLRVTLAPFSGAYYQLWIRPKEHEFGLDFGSSQKLNHERVQAFLPHQEALCRATGEQVHVGPWGSYWTRVWYELPKSPLTEELADTYAGRLHRLIQVTLPILRQVYTIRAAPVQPQQRTEAPPSVHVALDTQVTAVRDFLNGRSGRPSDERLCDWVNFCYEFGLFREGRDLFKLIDPSQVNDWYYERTKRLARVCAMKVAGQA